MDLGLLKFAQIWTRAVHMKEGQAQTSLYSEPDRKAVPILPPDIQILILML